MRARLGAALLAGLLALSGSGPARAADNPITIGFGMALTGGLAPNGKAALLAMQIWEEDINAKGGLLGRPVKLVYYDDQSNPVDACPASTPSCSTSTKSTSWSAATPPTWWRRRCRS